MVFLNRKKIKNIYKYNKKYYDLFVIDQGRLLFILITIQIDTYSILFLSITIHYRYILLYFVNIFWFINFIIFENSLFFSIFFYQMEAIIIDDNEKTLGGREREMKEKGNK